MKQVSKANPFFVEIIFVILFFAVSVAVTLQLFAAAHGKAQQSKELNAAVMQAQTVAESLSGITNSEQLSLLLPGSVKTNGENGEVQYILSYDKDWNATTQPASYQMKIVLKKAQEKNGTNLQAEITVGKMTGKDTAQKNIYSLTAEHYVAK